MFPTQRRPSNLLFLKDWTRSPSSSLKENLFSIVYTSPHTMAQTRYFGNCGCPDTTGKARSPIVKQQQKHAKHACNTPSFVVVIILSNLSLALSLGSILLSTCSLSTLLPS